MSEESKSQPGKVAEGDSSAQENEEGISTKDPTPTNTESSAAQT